MLCSINGFAQSGNIETVDGKQFYIHKVEKGVTLYSIARQYNVSVEDIKTENPFLDAGLQPGQTLRIPVVKAEIREVRNDTIVPDGYQAHIVERGETLYALSRKYAITVREILSKNPEVINGLKLGQRLLIPITPSRPKKKEKSVVKVDTDKYIKHVVDSGETLYSLSRFYEVSADSIMKLNGGLPKGLQLGMTLIIPKIKPSDVIMITEVMAGSDTIVLNDSIAMKNMYHVALILPMYLDTNQAMDETRREYDKDEIFPKSKIALRFYQGALLAVDSMRKQGISVKLYVFDTANDTDVVKGILNRPEMKEMNLIIGPLYRNNFMLVSEFAKKNRISIVSPVPQSNRILLGNPYVSKVSASRMIQIERMAEFVIEHHANDKVFVFHNNEERNKKFVDYFHKVASRGLDSLENAPMDSIQEIYFAKINASKIKVLLDTGTNNVIVIPSNNQAFVSEFLTQLNQLAEDYRITVYGMDRWKNFQNISTDYMHSLNVHITSPNVIN
ncbi:MAG: LysM peptidoglycan-binding domain-containing protein [Flavobacteriales bacterium]|nr:LysM peptidoglycan-binding domain-containing protein [Flavobacteriales bacterium]